jgi:hypothetical protein
MKALRQLGFLKITVRAENADEAEEERVLALFKNRAELKKLYGGLQEEAFRLKDIIKQQEGATQRVQDLLTTLEGRLSTPETAYPALVFYQLRRLWQSGRELISAFVADLARQQEERERRIHLAQHNREQFARQQSAQAAVHAAQSVHAENGARLSQLQTEGARLTRFWHYFKRRALERSQHGAQQAHAASAAALTSAQEALDAVMRTPQPDFPGLTVLARRAINLAAIAYAEVLCLRLAALKTPLVSMARAATAQREATDEYGTPKECVLLMGQIERAQQLIAERQGLPAEINLRSERLKRVVKYRGTNDSSPIPDSIALSEGDVLEGGALGNAAAALPNVLADDIWDLFRILLR